MPAVTLAELKPHLTQGASTAHLDGQEAELQSILDAAEQHVERMVGPLTVTSVADEVHTGPGPLLLRRYPVVSVTSATSGGAVVSDLDLDAGAGLLYGTFSWAHRSVKVSYTAGRSVVPADLKMAVLIIAAHLWQTQRVPGRSPGMAGSETDGAPRGFAIPNRAVELMAPYMLSGIA